MKKPMQFPAILITAVLSAVLVLGAQVAWAAFNDVNGSPFVDEISEIGSAGCASGFPDGSFRPRDQVNRQQFAYWTANCAGRARSATFSETRTQPSLGANFEMAFRSPGVPGNTGRLLVTGTVSSFTADEPNCPCQAQLQALLVGAGGAPPSATAIGTIADAGSPSSGTASSNLTVTHVFEVPTATDFTVRLAPIVFDADVASITHQGQLSAIYLPFDGTPTFG